MPRLAALLCALVLPAQAQAGPDCAALDKDAYRDGDTVPGYDAGRVVIGSGRLQFHSGPDPKCKMAGVFVIPGQSLVAYVESKGFTAVMFINKKTGDSALGWVETARLKRDGSGISPRP